jgi:hypothetical protein
MITEREISGTFIRSNMPWGRLIASSKSAYRDQNPGHDVLFNANIFILGKGKVWWGDIDLTSDWSTLEIIASTLGKSLYVLREMDGRFEWEESSDERVIAVAHAEIKP